jgi:hypothetical protein
MRLLLFIGWVFLSVSAQCGDTSFNANRLKGFKKLFYKLVILHPKINSSFERTLLRHYLAGSGETYLITETDFKKLNVVIPVFETSNCIVLKSNPQLCTTKVDLLPDAYFGWALGTATCIYKANSTELVSFVDVYDFNKKKKGQRSLRLELITRFFRVITPRSAKAFVVSYADEAYSLAPL